MASSIVIHIGRLPHHERWCSAFAEGLKRHGIAPRIKKDATPEACDLAVFWGHRQQAVISAQRARGRDYLVLENGYLGARTTTWASAGFNGLNGYANFMNQDMPPERWRKYWEGSLKPWKRGGDYVAVMGQVPGDQSLRGMDIYNWAAGIEREVRQKWHLPVLFCPHPQAPQAANGMKTVPARQEVFRDASGVITFNSNSAVDAVLAGIPAIVCDAGGMARPVASHSVEQGFITPQREQWAYNLAWAQWTEAEMREGRTWEHLRRRYV